MHNVILDDPSWMILNALPNIGPIMVKRLLSRFGDDPAKIFEANRKDLMEVEGIGSMLSEIILNWRDYFDLEKELDELSKYHGRFISNLSEDYPPLLKKIYDPPIGLYVFGDYIPKFKTIAIVGSRRSTLYGLKVAKQIASELAQLGFCIVSGMARGADAAAHEGALLIDGKTVAVLGCGANIIYPAENKNLYNKLRECGSIISEFPLGKQADKTTFPRRNRIVSGMSQAVVVIETNSNGGSMITARIAAEQGRHVFAVPGRIDQISSKGCNELIREGASLCMGIDSILEELNYLTQLELPLKGSQKTIALPEGLLELELKVFQALQEQGVATIDQLSMHLNLASQKVSSTLLMLELKKLAGKRADGAYEII